MARIVLGTALVGVDVDRSQSMALFDAMVELGGNAIDTAHEYGGGNSERIIGQWMHERGVRDQIIIISKGAAHSRDRRRLTTFDITSDLYDSLARLRTDYIDLYLLHSDDPDVPVGPLVDALDEHQRGGRIRSFGVSNWCHERIAEASAYAHANGRQSLTASSPQFSLVEQREAPWPGCVSIGGASGRSARGWYANNQMPVLAWSPLAGGFLSGRFHCDREVSDPRRLDRLSLKCYATDDNFERLERTATLAAALNLSLPQIALAYVLNQPLNICAVVGASTPEHFAAAVAACDVTLGPQEMCWLDWGYDSPMPRALQTKGPAR
jgi:aryl-alcohol dehydrogenase-like predicted oxidoreductase